MVNCTRATPKLRRKQGRVTPGREWYTYMQQITQGLRSSVNSVL